MLGENQPTARSKAAHERDLLRASRFLGIPNPLLGAALGLLLLLPLCVMLLPLAPVWLLLPCLLLGWLLLELLFLPRRLKANRLAAYASRNERARQAIACGVSLDDVRTCDD